jgi:hypothetical protein
MKRVKSKMRIIIIQERSLILENKSKIFDTKEKTLFILPFLSKFREESIFFFDLARFSALFTDKPDLSFK